MAIIDKPSNFFNTKLYTGNASSRTISGIGFQPDWTWSKNRGNDDNHYVFDSVRGATKYIIPDNNTAEGTASGITAWNSDGYALGSSVGINANGVTAVSWNWKAGTSFTNDASSTGIGSIDSAGSVNDTAGFSICTHTGTGSLGTIKHGLSTKPSVILTKERSEARDWIMYHQSLGATKYLYLNTTAAAADSDNFMNDTEPTSSVFTVKGFSEVNKASQTYVSYIFSEKQGYSKFSSYVGNGNADGAFVYLGFKPAFVIYKKSSGTENWFMHDNKRQGYNPENELLFPDLSNAESTDNRIDFLSNGFKATSSDGGINGSGATYIYMAFAENPFVASNFNAATAR